MSTSFFVVARALAVLCCVPAAVACSDPYHPARPLADSGSDIAAEVWTGTTPLYGTCGTDRECSYALGVVCLTTYPGGLCTHRCTSSGDCEAFGSTCVANVCLPRCKTNDGTCAKYGAACVSYSLSGSAHCVPACYEAARTPPGSPKCIAGTVCDAWANACFPTVSTIGKDNGAPCTDAAQCRGERCLLASEGFPDGYCVSYGRTPDKSEIIPGKPLPQSTCPAGSVAISSSLSVFGELSTCYRGCTSESECRPGYSCSGLSEFATGYCFPTDCSTGAKCPDGYRCAVFDGGIGGTCTK